MAIPVRASGLLHPGGGLLRYRKPEEKYATSKGKFSTVQSTRPDFGDFALSRSNRSNLVAHYNTTNKLLNKFLNNTTVWHLN